MKYISYNKLFIILLLSFNSQPTLFCQEIGAVKMTWDGDWNHWTLYQDESWDDELGEMELRWMERWDVWDYRIGEETGVIRLKWKGNPNIWELKANNKTITFETVWKGDFDTWRIRSKDGIIQISSRDKNIMEEWETNLNKEEGDWAMWTEYSHEISSWIILDELDKAYSLELKMIMLFIPIITHFAKR